MKKVVLLFAVLLFASSFMMAQGLNQIAKNDPTGLTAADTNAAYYGDQGVRSVWVAPDMDQDGKQEVLATDYSNGGRVHVFEMNGSEDLELVFSTPVLEDNTSNGSTTRWVRHGDLDGDGNLEFIFALTYNGADSLVQVWEYNGEDNGYGNGGAPSFQLIDDQFVVSAGTGSFRTNREVASVYDFDSDGRDELIMTNRDHGVYILGVNDQFPGFATWQLEGGDLNDVEENRWSGGSYWHSIPADIDGDGQMEIVNHYWNFYGFWAIEATGEDTYEYPAASNENAYHEYAASDAVSYMGIYAADVDGNGKDEVVGVGYGAGYKVGLLSLARGTDVLNGFTDSTQFAWISDGLWTLAGNEGGSHWGINAGDLDQDTKDEIYVGGSAGYNVSQMMYVGENEDDGGDVLDPANYENNVVFAGAEQQFFNVDIYDSAGVGVDTVEYESPFVSKVYAGSDLNENGDLEVVVSYQSVADSITYTYYTWSEDDQDYMLDREEKIASDKAVNIRVLEYTSTGVDVKNLNLVTPNDYVLKNNFPNPFNPSTQIDFVLPVDKRISVRVYDVLGNEVKTLINNQDMAKGSHSVMWNGTNNQNQSVASGTYIYTLEFGNFSKSQKMTLLK